MTENLSKTFVNKMIPTTKQINEYMTKLVVKSLKTIQNNKDAASLCCFPQLKKWFKNFVNTSKKLILTLRLSPTLLAGAEFSEPAAGADIFEEGEILLD